MKDEEVNLEEIEVSHTLGGVGEVVRGEGSGEGSGEGVMIYRVRGRHSDE